MDEYRGSYTDEDVINKFSEVLKRSDEVESNHSLKLIYKS